MPPPFLNLKILLLLLLSSIQIQSHTIQIPSSIPHPAGISWDPTAQHFLLFSSSHPTISSISDAGVTETLISDPLISSISSISIDNRRRRLLVSLLNPDQIAAFDLRSPRPHRLIFSSSLPFSPGPIAVDPHSGFAFVAASNTGVIFKVDLDGNVSEIYGGEGLVAVAYVRSGFLLAVEGKKGRILKVDDESGAAKEVIRRNWGLEGEMKGIAMMVDGRAVVACGKKVRIVKSVDGWSEGEVKGEVRVEGGKRFEGVGIREGKKVYVLVRKEGEELGGRIEEVEWEEEEDLMWLMVMVGIGLALFLFWRFQMRQLVENMNKKRA